MPAYPGGPTGPAPSLRPAGKLYTFTKAHLLLVAELHRLFPDQPPIVRFERIKPGLESIETVSVQLLDELRRNPDQRIFLVFCRLNSERILDHIDAQLDAGAWPIDRDELLGEVYGQLFRVLLRGTLVDAGDLPRSVGFKPPRGEWSVFDMLASAVDRILEEQITELRRFSVPLPGVPGPPVAPPRKTMKTIEDHLERKRCRLKEKELRQWVTHALLALDAGSRRVLHLRDHRQHTLEQLAEALGLSPWEAGRRLKDARLELQERIDSLVALFHGEGAFLASPPATDSRPDERDDRTDEEPEAEEDGSDADR